MLGNSNSSLKDSIDMCRAAELSQSQLADIRKQEEIGLHEMRKEKAGDCTVCGESGHSAQECPTRKSMRSDIQCFRCKGYGHISSVCPSGNTQGTPHTTFQGTPQQAQRGRRKRRGRGRGRGGNRQLHEVEEQTLDEYAQEFSSLTLSAVSINSVTDPSNARFVKFRYHYLPQKTSKTGDLKVDSGAAANVIPLRDYKELYPNRILGNGKPNPKFIQPSKSKLESYGGNKVSHFGTVKLPCEYNGKKFMCNFYLCDIEGSMLLGLPTCEALKIVKINIVDNEENVDNVNVQEVKDRSNGYIDPNVPIEERPVISNKEDLLKMYPECFQQKGKYFKNFEYDIKIDANVQPKAHPARRVPFEVREKLKEKLDEMMEKGIITKVEEPTRWVN